MGNFVFDDIHMPKNDPFIPYHDAGRPFVQAWFAGSEGSRCESFAKKICEEDQDRLGVAGQDAFPNSIRRQRLSVRRRRSASRSKKQRRW